MFNTKIITIFLLSVFISKSLQLTVSCDYQNSSTVANGRLKWKIVKAPYACIITTLDIKSKLRVINVNGTHLDGYKNSDIKALKIIGGKIIPSNRNGEIGSSCEIIPSGFGSIFPNIEALTVSQAKLKSVSSADLKQFFNLREIWLFVNDLEYLESKLFQYNPNVELISFNGNHIKYIGVNFFDYLPKLVKVLLHNNDCINEEAAVGTELNVLKQKIIEKCPVNETSESLQVTVDCQFEYSMDWEVVKHPYECSLAKLDIVKKISAINATGKHLSGKNNNDVKSITICGGKCQIIPSALGSIFPNIEALLVWNASLKHISSSDLQQFSNLKEIWLHDNELDYLESNLFEYNEKVEIVVVKGNKIKYIGGMFFDFLPNLRKVDFCNNECIDGNAVNAARLTFIKEQIKQNCALQGPEPRGYTTIRPDGLTWWINNTSVDNADDGQFFGGAIVDSAVSAKLLQSAIG